MQPLPGAATWTAPPCCWLGERLCRPGIPVHACSPPKLLNCHQGRHLPAHPSSWIVHNRSVTQDTRGNANVRCMMTPAHKGKLLCHDPLLLRSTSTRVLLSMPRSSQPLPPLQASILPARLSRDRGAGPVLPHTDHAATTTAITRYAALHQSSQPHNHFLAPRHGRALCTLQLAVLPPKSQCTAASTPSQPPSCRADVQGYARRQTILWAWGSDLLAPEKGSPSACDLAYFNLASTEWQLPMSQGVEAKQQTHTTKGVQIKVEAHTCSPARNELLKCVGATLARTQYNLFA